MKATIMDKTFRKITLLKRLQATIFQKPLLTIQCCFMSHEQFPANEQFTNQHCRGKGGKGDVTVVEFRREN